MPPLSKIRVGLPRCQRLFLAHWFDGDSRRSNERIELSNAAVTAVRLCDN